MNQSEKYSCSTSQFEELPSEVAVLYKREGAAMAGKESRKLKELFKDFGVLPATLAIMAQMGFTVSTLINMKDDEVDYVIKSMIEEYHLDLLMGEQFGIKAAVRAKRRLLDEEMEQQRMDLAGRTTDRKRKPEDPPDNLLLKDGMSLALTQAKPPATWTHTCAYVFTFWQ